MKEIMNLADPELELIDPTPNVHMLFIQFDKIFFYTKLASRAVVRWSKRMYSCAGICSYDRGGLCDIALSEPLLKLRPRKDLIETLLHEMIHAYLFVTCQDQDRDGHGPNFKSHMNRINNSAGLNISIYHDFHDEVKLYQTHWWRCNGACQTKKPHFGIVRRSVNRAPGPTDYWWNSHLRNCGGSFIKIKEPENYGKKKATPKTNNGNITKYINTKDKIKSVQDEKLTKPILKESSNVPIKSNFISKSNGSKTIVVSKKNNVVFNPQPVKQIEVFSGKGQTLSGRSTTISDIAETVRNIWANKQIPSKVPDDKKQKKDNEISKRNSISTVTGTKHKADNSVNISPPLKMKKIDDYFKTSAKTVLKDLYGQDFEIKEVNANKRLSVVSVQTDIVECPICNDKVNSSEVNRHLDECLNKEIIEKISKDSPSVPVICSENINKIIKVDRSKNDKNDIIKTENSMITIKSEPIVMKDILDINANYAKNMIKSENQIVSESEAVSRFTLPITKVKMEPKEVQIKMEPGTSKNKLIEQKCPCCEKEITNTMNEHLDECFAFFKHNTIIPEAGPSTSLVNETIVIDDDDDLDETLTLNATGTKSPCPCCLAMIELTDMNDHLDLCLN